MSSRFDPYLEWLGIRPEEQPADHYRLLGLQRFESDRDLIDSSAENRMKLLRQFQTGPRGRLTQPLLNQISVARRCLLDVGTKSRYDAELEAAARPSSGDPAPPPIEGPMAPPVASPPQLPPAAPPLEPEFGGRVGVNQPASQLNVRKQRRSAFGPVFSLLGLAAIALVVWGIGRHLAESRSAGEEDVRGGTASSTQPHHETSPSTQPQPREAQPTENVAQEPRENEPVLVMQEGNGEVHLSAATAELLGEGIQLVERAQQNWITRWTSFEQSVQWRFKLVNPGVFRVDITYAVADDAVDGQYELVLNGQPTKTYSLRKSGGAERFVTDHHFLAVPRSGLHQLRLRPIARPGAELMTLKEVRLVPSGRRIPAS